MFPAHPPYFDSLPFFHISKHQSYSSQNLINISINTITNRNQELLNIIGCYHKFLFYLYSWTGYYISSIHPRRVSYFGGKRIPRYYRFSFCIKCFFFKGKCYKQTFDCTMSRQSLLFNLIRIVSEINVLLQYFIHSFNFHIQLFTNINKYFYIITIVISKFPVH